MKYSWLLGKQILVSVQTKIPGIVHSLVLPGAWAGWTWADTDPKVLSPGGITDCKQPLDWCLPTPGCPGGRVRRNQTAQRTVPEHWFQLQNKFIWRCISWRSGWVFFNFTFLNNTLIELISNKETVIKQSLLLILMNIFFFSGARCLLLAYWNTFPLWICYS